MAERHKRITGWLLLGAVGGPPALMSVFLALAYAVPLLFPDHSAWVALSLGVTVGVACIARLPVTAALRVYFALLYIPAAASGLFVYSVYFAGFVFGDWM